ncbi:helix-turn-helix domain-containing protein [Vibrio breoganii]|uniref:helix-turn-helix domain-containing protein n=1 Tax=Vibrio breoganii TaxID=553239 RepID=UPI000C85D315|nr:helix-turn-helix domain-containing protein [Vibrio breoganii]
MLIAHKVELRPTKPQADYLNKCIGHSRNIYNNLLRHFSQEGVKWSKKEARIKFMELRATDCPYYDDISADFLRESINNLDNAYKHFFRRVKNGEGKAGYPTKRKLGVHDVCALRDKKKFLVGDDGLRFEKFNKRKTQSPIKLREKLRFTGTVKQMNISKRAGKYFSRSLLIPKTTTDSNYVIKPDHIVPARYAVWSEVVDIDFYHNPDRDDLA